MRVRQAVGLIGGSLSGGEAALVRQRWARV